MEECRFCTNKDNQDWLVDRKWPFAQENDLLLQCLIVKNSIEMSCYAQGGRDGIRLFDITRKINYCPMCGRKLTERKTE